MSLLSEAVQREQAEIRTLLMANALNRSVKEVEECTFLAVKSAAASKLHI